MQLSGKGREDNEISLLLQDAGMEKKQDQVTVFWAE